MKPSEKQKLLAEILPGEDAADFERASLARGLAGLRRRRRRGYLIRASALVVVVGLVTLGIFLKEHDAVRRGAADTQLASAPAAVVAPHVEVISDDELLAMFPGRSLALIGKPGQQRLVFLDKPERDPGRVPF